MTKTNAEVHAEKNMEKFPPPTQGYNEDTGSYPVTVHILHCY